MTILDFESRARDAAFVYADALTSVRVDGSNAAAYEHVKVFSYRTYLDNIDPSFRSHREAYGYAIEYSSTPELNFKVNGAKGHGAYHDRSLTVFCGETTGLTQRKLRESGGILADFSIINAFDFPREPCPMYVAGWSPADNEADMPPSVILKRFPVNDTGDPYPFMVGPRPMYHLVLRRLASHR